MQRGFRLWIGGLVMVGAFVGTFMWQGGLAKLRPSDAEVARKQDCEAALLGLPEHDYVFQGSLDELQDGAKPFLESEGYERVSLTSEGAVRGERRFGQRTSALTVTPWRVPEGYRLRLSRSARRAHRLNLPPPDSDGSELRVVAALDQEAAEHMFYKRLACRER